MHDLFAGDWFTTGPLRLNLDITPAETLREAAEKAVAAVRGAEG